MGAIVIGCERSGTKMLLERLPKPHVIEPKEVVGIYRTHEELVKYGQNTERIMNIAKAFAVEGTQKHSLNMTQAMGFIWFLRQAFPDAEFHYIRRNPVAVVQSMMFKLWKHYPKKSVDDAIQQWNYIEQTCLPYAKEIGAVIHQYEDYCDNDIILPDNMVKYVEANCR
jgi:hypothetical protein